jgi:hypothetical protein
MGETAFVCVEALGNDCITDRIACFSAISEHLPRETPLKIIEIEMKTLQIVFVQEEVIVLLISLACLHITSAKAANILSFMSRMNLGMFGQTSRSAHQCAVQPSLASGRAAWFAKQRQQRRRASTRRKDAADSKLCHCPAPIYKSYCK